MDELYDIKNIFKGKQTPFTKNLFVIIVNLPCNGFGDIIFAMKFSNILKEWYGCKVKIVTTQKNAFISLGEDPSNLYELQSKIKNTQCRRLNRLNIHGKKYIKADLIFVAPLQADFEPHIEDIKRLFPYSNRFNTFFLSEYNDNLGKKIDFHTGIGKNRYGLLFTDIKETSPLKELKYPYAVVYIQPHIGNYRMCLYNFIKLISMKYNKTNFEIILPNWVNKQIIKNILNITSLHFKTVVVQMHDEKVEFEGNGSNNTLYIRLDIFPLPNKKMIDLMVIKLFKIGYLKARIMLLILQETVLILVLI